MSRGINKVTLIGNIGRDLKLGYMPNGNAYVNFSLATSETWTDKNTKQTKERTEWHRIVIFGKLAEICNSYAEKGTRVYIEGQLKTRSWTDDSGIERYTTEIHVNPITGVFEVLSGGVQKDEVNELKATQEKPKSGYKYKAESPKVPSNGGKAPKQPEQPEPPKQPEPPMDFDDDIPF